jgi:hypothetical protein
LTEKVTLLTAATSPKRLLTFLSSMLIEDHFPASQFPAARLLLPFARAIPATS